MMLGELLAPKELELELPERDELELLGVADVLLLEGGTDEDGVVPGGVVVTPLEHGVVGWALAQAQRELAAPKTAPADAPQALITQFRAAD